MDCVKVRARAKINLSIDIKGVLEGGYHDVEMVMQSVNLSDHILIRKVPQGFKITSSNSDVPLDQKNIIYKTWELIRERYSIKGGIYVFLEKNIPIAAGMAGGSTDSAAMFVGLNELFNLSMSEEEMIEYSKELGSDIAFCIKGGTYLATGTGTDLKKLPNFDKTMRILICKPDVFVSTKRVYKRYDNMYEDGSEPLGRPNNKVLIEGLSANDMVKVIAGMGNVLEPVTKSWCREIERIEKEMEEYGAVATMMSGSGPTVFGFFNDYRSIKKCSNILRERYRQTYITSASDKGVEIYGNR